jgi:AraC-like DNA-binding protein
MDIKQIIDNGKFVLQEAAYAKVGSYWEKIVTFYKLNRIYFVVDGEAEITLKNMTYKLSPNKLYYIPEYSIVNGNCENILCHYYLHFKTDKMTATLLKFITLKEIDNPLNISEELFKIIIGGINNKNSSTQISAESAFKLLLSCFLREVDKISPNIIRFLDVLNYIDVNIKNKITIKELAEINNLNEVYFSNLFTKTFNITPQEYIISKRIDYACSMLSGLDLSIKEVAYNLNYSDEAFFSKQFKKITGMSPFSFRAAAIGAKTKD